MLNFRQPYAVPNMWRQFRASDSRDQIDRAIPKQNRNRCPCAVSPDSHRVPMPLVPLTMHLARCKSVVHLMAHCHGWIRWASGDVPWSRRRATAADKSAMGLIEINYEINLRNLQKWWTGHHSQAYIRMRIVRIFYLFPIHWFGWRLFLFHNHRFQTGHFSLCGLFFGLVFNCFAPAFVRMQSNFFWLISFSRRMYKRWISFGILTEAILTAQCGPMRWFGISSGTILLTLDVCMALQGSQDIEMCTNRNVCFKNYAVSDSCEWKE